MKFLDEYDKESAKIKGVSTEAGDPRFWISTGNYVINSTVSGQYRGGIGQGKMAMLAGPSSAGKSFVACNILKAAQDQGCGILVVDSENALDDSFVRKVGGNPDDDYYIYRGVSTVEQCKKVVSGFIQSYKKHGETKPFLIVIDSLDALMTESQMTAYEAGEVKGDQGQHAKQLKGLVGGFMQDIKDVNIAILCTKQVFKEQDPIKAKNPATEWVVTEALKYAFAQIMLITRFMLKDDDTKTYEGIRLRVFNHKSRFAKPFQHVVVDVPYETGMDPYSGLLDAAVSIGVITRNGAWYTFDGTKFQSKNFHTIQEKVLEKMIENQDVRVQVDLEDAISLEE